MRFRTKERPRGVLRRSDQRRLTLLVLGVGVILVCFSVVRRPEFWGRLFPEEGDVAALGEAGPTVAPGESTARTNMIATNGLRHDEFVTSGGERPMTAEAPNTVVANRISYDEVASSSATDNVGIPKVPDDLLKSVKDDVIGVQSAEDKAYYASITLASKIEQRKSLNAKRGFYALFMDSPAGARGIAWKMSGQLRRLSEVKGKTNAFGVGMLYDAWITTPDSGDQLVHVVAQKADTTLARLIAPDNVERSADFMDKNAPNVTFTGYFFKREGYASNSAEGLSLAPLFLAGTLHEVPKVAITSTRAEQLTPYLGWLAFAVCLGIGLMLVWFWSSDAAHAQSRAHQLTKLPAHATFDDISAVTVAEALGDLQSAERVET